MVSTEACATVSSMNGTVLPAQKPFRISFLKSFLFNRKKLIQNLMLQISYSIQHSEMKFLMNTEMNSI